MSNAIQGGIISLENFNFWRRYRGEQELTQAQADAIYRTRAHVPNIVQQPAIPPAPQLRAPGIVQWVPPLAIPSEIDFLTAAKPGIARDPNLFPNDALNWTGRKLLGQGSFGRAGLWEYTGNAANAPTTHARIVVKEVLPELLLPPFTGEYLSREAVLLQGISPVNGIQSPHISAPVRPIQVIDAARDGEDPGLDGTTIRIFMEYCQLGGLDKLLDRRETMQKPFLESTLWNIFECLVDGIGVLEHGGEFSLNAKMEPVLPPPREGWVPIVHFDLKPDNILLGDRNKQHRVTPICKINHRLRPDEYAEDYDDTLETEEWRNSGTEGYHAPEQFTERWDFNDWQSSNNPNNRIAGFFSDKTNVWGIGCIMWKLACLDVDGVPDPKIPFTPTFNLSGSPPKGRTYGIELRSFSRDLIPAGQAVPPGRYSRRLIDMIFECLYEIPRHRSTPIELKERIKAAYDLVATQNSDVDMYAVEPWEDFEPTTEARYQAAVAAQQLAQQQAQAQALQVANQQTIANWQPPNPLPANCNFTIVVQPWGNPPVCSAQLIEAKRQGVWVSQVQCMKRPDRQRNIPLCRIHAGKLNQP